MEEDMAVMSAADTWDKLGSSGALGSVLVWVGLAGVEALAGMSGVAPLGGVSAAGLTSLLLGVDDPEPGARFSTLLPTAVEGGLSPVRDLRGP